MSRTTESMIFKAFTFSDLSSADLARSVIDYLLRSGEDWAPSLMGQADPPDMPFSRTNVEQAIEVLQHGKSTDRTSVGHIYLGRGEPPRVLYYLTWYRGPKPEFNQVSAQFPLETISRRQDVESLLDFVKGLFDLVDGVYGFIAHSAEWRAGHIRRRVLERRIVEERLVKFSPDTPLTGIYWANFFGHSYVTRFREGCVERVAAHRKESTPKGTLLIITAPSPLDYEKLETQNLKESIKRDLGQDAFLGPASA